MSVSAQNNTSGNNTTAANGNTTGANTSTLESDIAELKMAWDLLT